MIAFLDTPSGISGDIFLGCLVDAGWPLAALRGTVEALAWPDGAPPEGWAVQAREVQRQSLRATWVQVRVPEAGQPHRHLSDIRALLVGSALPEGVVADALAVFERLARAEARVHGTALEEVHFHEVGALDSIVDVVGSCAGLHALGVTRLHAAPLPLGPGSAQTAHGPLPLPAPATLELIAQAGGVTRPAPGPGELVTPTGAALVLHFAAGRWQQPPMQLRRVGIGAGTKEFAWPNIARLWLGAGEAAGGERHLEPSVLIESNIDDMNPELYAAVAEKLFAEGARDVWWVPIQMKKNRPGVQLSVLAPRRDEARMAALLLRETSTLGMRVLDVRGHVAERQMAEVETPYGPIPVKLKRMAGEIVGAVPEFEPCRALARQLGLPTRQIYEAAAALAWHHFLRPGA